MPSYSTSDTRDAEENADQAPDQAAPAGDPYIDAVLAGPDDPEPEPSLSATDPAPSKAPTPTEPLDQDEIAAVAELADQPKALETSLAPGCYGMGFCYCEGSAECSTCPFASACKPLAEEQLATLRPDIESRKEDERRKNRGYKRKERAKAAPAPTLKTETKRSEPPAAPTLKPAKAMLQALEQAVAGRRSTDRFLEKLVNPEMQREYVRVAIISWRMPELSARKIADLYNAKTGKTGKDALDKKKVENRLKVVRRLVAADIWKPI